ncbi:MAG: hypothetical protein N2544_13205 [Burkholderiales bacterium]|nr:hypothetical protein [Burkholderiales bacterium]
MANAGSDQAELQALLARLGDDDRRTLLAFARFLAAHGGAPGASERVVLPRPESETVVQAVKRLNASYPGLERRKLVARVGVLLSSHMVDGRDAASVIDELEALYLAAYSEAGGE